MGRSIGLPRTCSMVYYSPIRSQLFNWLTMNGLVSGQEADISQPEGNTLIDVRTVSVA